MPLRLCGTFAVDGLETPLRSWVERVSGVPVQLHWVPYSPLILMLGDENSVVRCGKGVTAVLVRVTDLAQGHPEDRCHAVTKKKLVAEVPAPLTRHELETAVRTFTTKLVACAAAAVGTFLVVCMPLPPAETAEPSRAEMHADLEQQLVAAVAGQANVHVVTSATVHASLCDGQYYDGGMDIVAHSPFTPLALSATAGLLVRWVARLGAHPRKVVVLDCDNTLWGGAVGEVGPAGVVLTDPYLRLQAFFVGLQQRGMLLCLCSRNEDADVAAVFASRTDMVLRLDTHIVHRRVNWQPKSANVAAMCAELNLGLDSVIFVDDNPVECHEVRCHCPGALVVTVPRDAARIPSLLAQHWAFDAPLGRGKRTAEDGKRTQLYKSVLQRNQLRSSSSSMSAFQASLNLWVDIAPMDADSVDRVAQLTDRTNQHNACKRPWTVAELTAMQGASHDIFVVTAGDRFASHGLVGAMLVAKVPLRVHLKPATEPGGANRAFLDPTSTIPVGAHHAALPTSSHAEGNGSAAPAAVCMAVDGFMLSCRALHIGVEHAMMRHLAREAQARHAHLVAFAWQPAPRNEPARAFLFSLRGARYVGVRVGDKDAGASSDADTAATQPPEQVRRQPPAVASSGGGGDSSCHGDGSGGGGGGGAGGGGVGDGGGGDIVLPPEADGMSKRERNRLRRKLRAQRNKALGLGRHAKRKLKKKSQATQVVPAAGISMYRHDCAEKPGSGVVFVTAEDLAGTALRFASGGEALSKTHAQQNGQAAGAGGNGESLPGFVTAHRYSLHSETYQTIADQLSSDAAGMHRWVASVDGADGAAEAVSGGEGGIRNTLDQLRLASDAFEVDAAKQEVETLAEYRRRMDAKKALRYQMKLAIQQLNSESYYSDVQLHVEDRLALGPDGD